MGTAHIQPPPLFSAGDAEDIAYTNLRDEVSVAARTCKQFSEQLWAQYHSYADPHFLTEIRRDFGARFWEMYLTCALLEDAPRLGYTVACPKPGPDNLIVYQGRNVWIEAIVATDGDPAKPDSAVEEHSGTIPDAKILLRYANAIMAKHAKYEIYRKDGIIKPGDAYVIAISGAQLSYRWADPGIPRFLKAVFPLGALEVIIDRKTGQVVDRRHQFRRAVAKKSGSEVQTDIFVDGQFAGISAVLHSYANALCKPPMSTDFVVAHNPLASQPVALGVLPSRREYQAADIGDDTYELRCHSGACAPP